MMPIGSSVNVAAAHADAHGHLELAAVGHRRDDVLGVDERELSGNLQVGTRDHTRALGGNVRNRFLDVIVEGLEHQPLHVQNDVSDILDYALGRGELVLHALDLDGGRLRAVKRGEKNATQRVAERVAIAALERLDDETRDRFVHFFRCNCRPHELCHVNKPP